jgi:hypothetical protein
VFFFVCAWNDIEKGCFSILEGCLAAGLSDIYKLRAAEAAAKLLNNFKRKEYIFSR